MPWMKPKRNQLVMQILKGKWKPCLMVTCKWCIANDWICATALPPPSSPIASSLASLLAQRAELHMDMKNFNQAIQDGDSVCRLLPASPKVRRSLLSTSKNPPPRSHACVGHYSVTLWALFSCLPHSNNKLSRCFSFIPTLVFNLNWNTTHITFLFLLFFSLVLDYHVI